MPAFAATAPGKIILFGEQRELTAAFYAGVMLVFGVVFFHALQVAN